MEDNCAVTLQKWRTIVLLHFRNGGQLCCYTSEMEDNCAVTLQKWRTIVLLHLGNGGKLYSLHLEKRGKLFLLMEMGGHIIIKLQCTNRKWRDKLCSLHLRNVVHQKWTDGKMAGEIVRVAGWKWRQVWFLMCGGMYHRIYWWIS